MMCSRFLIMLTLIASCGLFTSSGFVYGQIKAVEAGSVEGLLLLQEQRLKIAAQKSQIGELSISNLKEGHWGFPIHLDAKVIQVIDQKSMLIGVEDDRIGAGKYAALLLLKCSTTGIVDGKFWRSEDWEEIVGTKAIQITGTYRYKTLGGGTNTVFVVEALGGSELDKKIAKARIYRTWTSGRDTVRAKFIKIEKNDVTLETEDTKEMISVSQYDLSRGDRKWIREELKRRQSQAGQESTEDPQKIQETTEGAKPMVNQPNRWLNQTYKVTVRRLDKNSWEEVDDKTGRVLNTYKTVTDEKSYTELYDKKRNFEVRLYDDKMMLKKDGKWIFVAHGQWVRQPD